MVMFEILVIYIIRLNKNIKKNHHHPLFLEGSVSFFYGFQSILSVSSQLNEVKIACIFLNRLCQTVLAARCIAKSFEVEGCGVDHNQT